MQWAIELSKTFRAPFCLQDIWEIQLGENLNSLMLSFHLDSQMLQYPIAFWKLEFREFYKSTFGKRRGIRERIPHCPCYGDSSMRISLWHWCVSMYIAKKNWFCDFKSYGGRSDVKILKIFISVGPNPLGFTIAKLGFFLTVWKVEILSLRIWLPNVT